MEIAPYPPDPLLVHPLSPAPHFVGRAIEVAALRQLWQTGVRGVAALVGLGGAGKTAVTARFLEDMLAGRAPPQPGGIFVWSFYQQPDAGLFLQEAFRYFTRDAATPARGAGLLHLLCEALSNGGPYLLVLDGLERVQLQEGADSFGQLEDPLLKGLLVRLAEGAGLTTALITSRFPLTDLRAFEGRGYRHLDVGGLDTDAARALLRQRGVQGGDADLDRLIDNYGAHALTLDHLGGLIGQFCGGDPAQAPALPEVTASGTDRQGLRLARLLRAYEQHLPPTEFTLLCRLSLLRRSVTAEQIDLFLLCNPQVHSRTVHELAESIVRMGGTDQFATSVCTTVQLFLCAAPLAGPEETIRRELLEIAETALATKQIDVERAADELASLYSAKELDPPTDALPLLAIDRDWLRVYYPRYRELREHPSLQYQDVPPALEQAFWDVGYSKKKQHHPEGTLHRDEVMRNLIPLNRSFHFLTCTHFALQRVRELCRLQQRKWALAGPLAELSAPELRQVLEALVGRHLILREADGSFSVHPAVRDHFARLAVGDGGAWQNFIREQLVTLVQRPGRRLPEDPATLDLVEEAIHHALATGRTDEAVGLFQEVLGGVRHLAWKLGEMARGLRILRAFDPCPDRWALAWFLRGLGEFAEAYRLNALPYFRADLLLLQGQLAKVAAEGEPTRTAIAQFLMGRTRSLPPQPLGCPIARDQLLLYLGRAAQLQQTALMEGMYHEMGWEGDRARCLLLLADAARRLGELGRARQRLDAAAAWVLRSGSVEHLCLFHLVEARLAREAGKFDGLAQSNGLHLARHSGLGLYLIELLCEQAELALATRDPADAEGNAREALQRASAAACQFQWGAAEAGHLLGRALVAQGRTLEARAILGRTLALRQRIGDPRADATEQLLQRLQRPDE